MKECEFYIELNQVGGGARLPEGFHFEGERNRICPRGLEDDGANPYGQCKFYNKQRCVEAMEEELNCPARRGRAQRQINELFGDEFF